MMLSSDLSFLFSSDLQNCGRGFQPRIQLGFKAINRGWKPLPQQNENERG
jgi:hypothetical protein